MTRTSSVRKKLKGQKGPELLGRGFADLNLRTNHRIIVGVDYGTTYTGISYIDSTNTSNCTAKDVNDIRTYPGPGREGDAVWKTPSRIAYASENEGCTSNQFGFQVTPKMVSYSWTKLLLDEHARITEFDDPSLKRGEGKGMLRLPPGKTATEVVTDFLTEIYGLLMEYLAKRLSPEILEMTPLEFWFTVPAIWTDQAKHATLQAAKAAGFASSDEDKIFLIPEPEAAGVATLKGLSEGRSVATTQPGDGVLICDCGGGTVDITSYKVVQTQPRLTFEEIVEGTGGKCGSTYIDREFRKWMSTTFGPLFDNLKFEKTGPGSRFMKDFESAKRDFGVSQNLDQTIEINIVIPGQRDSDYYNQEESVVTINGHVMRTFFQPVVTKVLALLESQVERARKSAGPKAISRVVLVGGFGDSLYLNACIKDWCEQKQLSLTCPEHPQAAIARGAALRGLDSIAPIRRRSRRHYGITSNHAFREGIDPESLASISRWSGEKNCRGKMLWAIKKGQVIDEDTKIILDRSRIYREGTSFTFESELYACSSDIQPEYRIDPEVEAIATLTHTANPAHLGKFRSKIVNGSKCWKLEYEREICMGSKEGTLSFRVVHDGEEWGNAAIEYNNT